MKPIFHSNYRNLDTPTAYHELLFFMNSNICISYTLKITKLRYLIDVRRGTKIKVGFHKCVHNY